MMSRAVNNIHLCRLWRLWILAGRWPSLRGRGVFESIELVRWLGSAALIWLDYKWCG